MAGETNWVKYFNEQGKGFRPDLASLRLVYLHGQKMPRAQLSGLSLQGADLRWAQMQGADLVLAQIQGANFMGAQMQGADLRFAQMQGADLSSAQMQGAYLGHAQMQGAYLRDAKMQGANLRDVKLQGAVLRDVQMQGAVLRDVQMQGAVLRDAQMQGVILSDTSVQGALLDSETPVYGENSIVLFNNRVSYWAEIEKMAEDIPYSSMRQQYLQQIKQAQQPNQINQAQQKLRYEPKTIANSALSAICNSKDALDDIQPKETRLASAQAFRNSYSNLREEKYNPDYPNILLDIDYQLCTLDKCKDLRDGIEGLDCQKALQNPPKW